MQTDGFLAPETPEAVRADYESLGPVAQTVVKETARSMAFDREEYRDRVTSDVVETARDALFASLLVVHTGSREAFDDWLEAEADDCTVEVEGSDQVDNVAWHLVPFTETVVAATYQHERDAAVGTLRRIAFGRVYRETL